MLFQFETENAIFFFVLVLKHNIETKSTFSCYFSYSPLFFIAVENPFFALMTIYKNEN